MWTEDIENCISGRCREQLRNIYCTFSATNSHMHCFTLGGGGGQFFLTFLDSIPKRGVLFSSLLWEMFLDINGPQNCPSTFRCMVSFQNTTLKKNAFLGVELIFFITLGRDVNRISTNPGTVLKLTLFTFISIIKIYPTTFELDPLKCCISLKNELGENCIWSYAGAVQSIVSVISN